MAPSRRGAAPPLMAAIAVVALIATSFAFITLRPSQDPIAPAAAPSATPLPLDPADEALFARMENLWANDATDVAAVMDIYATDAVHTAMWTDEVQRFTGNDAIANRILLSKDLSDREKSERVRVEDGPGGEHRYLQVIESYGMPCVWWLKDGVVTRHDCILPMPHDGAVPILRQLPESATEDREAFQELFSAGWNGDREAFDSVVHPDVVHYVAWDNHAVPHRGRDKLWSVADQPSLGSPVDLAPTIDLPAPEGQRRWTDFSTVGGGTLCVFWTSGGQLVRQDCIVPTSMSRQTAPNTSDLATPDPAGT